VLLNRKSWWIAALGGATLLAGKGLYAAHTPSGALVFEFLASGGPVMVPIALCSVVGLAFFLERIWALKPQRVIPRELRIEISELAKQKRFADALTLCRKHDFAICRILEVVFVKVDKPRARIKEATEEVGRREVAELERHTEVVGTVAAVAPLLGLLGTVLGMILTFEVIQDQGLGVVSSLAGGISQALVTTFAGLSVGIPALIGHRYLLTRVDSLVLDLEQATSVVLDLVEDAA
jgi:biopolymer transport protein ExbB